MTQKGELFKGQKKKPVTANRHGKAPHVRKGRTFKEPHKRSKEAELNKEVSKFINQANEAKAAAAASKDGARLQIVKAPSNEAGGK